MGGASATGQRRQQARRDHTHHSGVQQQTDRDTHRAPFPDLTRTPLLWSQEGFDTIVLKGALKDKGMASFAEVLKPADTLLIRDFIIDRANQLKNNPQAAGAPPAAVGAHEQH